MNLPIPKPLNSLDWWFSPFDFGGYYTDHDQNNELLSTVNLKLMKRINNEIFSSTTFTDLRGSESREDGLERLIWFFDHPLASSQWCKIFETLWSGSKSDVLISCYCQMIELLKTREDFWIWSIDTCGLALEVTNGDDLELLQTVARVMKPARENSMSESEFIDEFCGNAPNPLWIFNDLLFV